MRIVAVSTVVLLVACMPAPKKNLNIERLWAELEEIRQGQLAPFARTEKLAAQRGLEAAEQASGKRRVHLEYLAERRVDLARTVAQRQQDEAEIRRLESAYKDLLVKISMQEAERARREADRFRMESSARAEEAEMALAQARAALEAKEMSEEETRQALEEAEQARRLAAAREREADLARAEAELASQAAAELRRQLAAVQSRQTERGMVLTLGDIVFETGEAQLRPEVVQNLDRVLQFINRYPDEQIMVEGHTDSVGSAASNLQLSQHRADAVKRVLIENGVDGQRISAKGMGEDFPVASNELESGRQQNRRVEIIIDPQG